MKNIILLAALLIYSTLGVAGPIEISQALLAILLKIAVQFLDQIYLMAALQILRKQDTTRIMLSVLMTKLI